MRSLLLTLTIPLDVSNFSLRLTLLLLLVHSRKSELLLSLLLLALTEQAHAEHSFPMHRVVGRNRLQALLRAEQSRLGRAPVLFIRDEADHPTIGQISFEFQMKHNLNTFFSTMPTTKLLPTRSDLHQATTLARRVGASTVAAVGSLGAMSLGAAVPASTNNHRCILIPTTYEACLFAAAPSALLLDQEDEAVLPAPSMKASRRTVVHLEESAYRLDRRKEEAVQAAVAVVLDRLEKRADASVLEILDHSLSHEEIVTFLHNAGQSMSFGDGPDDVRSIPLAVVAALLPTCFPDSTVSNLMASLVRQFDHVHGGGTLLVTFSFLILAS